MKVKIIRGQKHIIAGEVVVDRITKELVKRLKPKSIAIIHHTDLDEMAAESLLRKQPQAIINFGKTITSKYPAQGARHLMLKNIPIFDVSYNHSIFNQLQDGMTVTILIDEQKLFIPQLNKEVFISQLSNEDIMDQINSALLIYNQTFNQFAENSLHYAQLEREEFCKSLPKLSLRTALKKRPVVIVTRGSNVYQDFEVIRPFIRAIKPVLIGVDGGADIIYEYGFLPHIIVGDMDSVSTKLLQKISDRIVHSYPNGNAPGLKRLIDLRLDYHLLPFLGTSEDVTLLLAYEYGANKIVLIGSHTHMIDFLEKGRRGMGSTILTRMKMGHLLIDAKGIHTLMTTQSNMRISYLFFASSVPIFALLLVSPELRFFAYTIWIQFRMLFY